jgi:hypothetical protein
MNSYQLALGFGLWALGGKRRNTGMGIFGKRRGDWWVCRSYGAPIRLAGHHRFQFLHRAQTARHFGHDAGLRGGLFRPFRAWGVFGGVTQGGGAGRLALG